MDTNLHNLTNLFAQLGLDNSTEGIDNFIKDHQINNSELLMKAPFWSTGQASFIKESLEQDSDWTEVIDQLDTMLRN